MSCDSSAPGFGAYIYIPMYWGGRFRAAVGRVWEALSLFGLFFSLCSVYFSHHITRRKRKYASRAGHGSNADTDLVLWITDILCNRKQCVVLNGEQSSWFNMLSGIPQGSILGLPHIRTLVIFNIHKSPTGALCCWRPQFWNIFICWWLKKYIKLFIIRAINRNCSLYWIW